MKILAPLTAAAFLLAAPAFAEDSASHVCDKDRSMCILLIAGTSGKQMEAARLSLTDLDQRNERMEFNSDMVLKEDTLINVKADPASYAG